MKKKLSILLISLSLIFLLSGFEFLKEVELTYKKPLIDLYGNTSQENPFNFSEIPDREEGEGIPEEKEEEPEVTSTPSKKRHTMGVKYKTITWGGRECSTEELKDIIDKEVSDGDEIIIFDNYAEYHAYSDVKKLLDEYKKDRHFILTEKVTGGKDQ